MLRSRPCPSSLRERKRVETRSALTQAAYEIVRDDGVDAVTAEAVADRAGVSRRTFFNYFPSVDSVLSASVEAFFASISEQLSARPADEPVRVSLLAVLEGAGDLDLVERIGVLAAAGDSSRHAQALILIELHEWKDWFEGWLRERLGPDPSDLHVAALAGILTAAGEAVLRVWSRTPADGSVPTSPTFHESAAEVLSLLGPTLLPDASAVRPLP